ncbi:MAG: hypothetical protein Q9160_002757 [Pyrenula sp. 1 TL-2023]
MSPPQRHSPDLPRVPSPIPQESEPDVVTVTEYEERPRRRSRELKIGFGLHNPFKQKSVRIVDRRQRSRRRSIDGHDRGRSDERPHVAERRARHYVSPGGTIRIIPPRREQPTVEYISPHRTDDDPREPHDHAPAVEVLDSGDESPFPYTRHRADPTASEDEVEERMERLEIEARRARKDASRERRRRREAEGYIRQVRMTALDERDRRHDAERRSRLIERQINHAEDRRVRSEREAARARAVAEEERQQRRLTELFPASMARLRLRDDFERGEDLRRETEDPGARLILHAQEEARRRDRDRDRDRPSRRGNRIIYDDDDLRGGIRWR